MRLFDEAPKRLEQLYFVRLEESFGAGLLFTNLSFWGRASKIILKFTQNLRMVSKNKQQATIYYGGIMRNENLSKSISTGILLIGLGVLVWTGWWWPGIMLVLGLSGAAELVVRGKILPAIGTFLLFLAIPLAIAIITKMQIPWLAVGALVLISIGVVTIFKGILQR